MAVTTTTPSVDTAPYTATLCRSSPLPDLMWIGVSFLMYSSLMLYLGIQSSRSGYMGSRGSGTRIRFPENLMAMSYVWMLHVVFNVLTAFMTYLVSGGWTGLSTVVLSLYLLMEAVHSVWMAAFFRFGMYKNALVIKVFSIAVQSYMLLLYVSIHVILAIIYFVSVAIVCYEAAVNIIVIVQNCRRQRLSSSRQPEHSIEEIRLEPTNDTPALT